jgi:tetratricopeptide (TPR) repeat protein
MRLDGFMARSLASTVFAGLAACGSMQERQAALPQDGATARAAVPGAPALSRPALREAVLAALARGDGESARDTAQDLVFRDPLSSSAHLLLAAGYHLHGDPAALDLAASGYGAAIKLAANEVWPHCLAGAASLRRNQPENALEHFAAAVLADPEHLYSLEGLASAAFITGQLPLAEAAARRAAALAPDSAIAWRVTALVLGASGGAAALDDHLARAPRGVGADQRAWVRARATNLVRTAGIDQAEPPRGALPAPADAVPGGATRLIDQQLTVDVTLILSDERRTRAQGVNLLDGLQGVFGFGRVANDVFGSSGTTYQTTITRAIRIPDITYNLNIFNRGERLYHATARPSLTAFVGQPSAFFIGEQIQVSVSGVQVAQLQNIDVGVSLKITPSEVRPDGARFRVEVDRGFFSDPNLGTFKESLSTFKQSVAATADVRYGETVILSGLSEQVEDDQSSRTPALGDIPVVDIAFKRSTQLKRMRSAIVLVTPSQSRGTTGPAKASPVVERLLRNWESVIERGAVAGTLEERIRRAPAFTRASHADAPVRDLRDAGLREAFLRDMRLSESI